MGKEIDNYRLKTVQLVYILVICLGLVSEYNSIFVFDTPLAIVSYHTLNLGGMAIAILGCALSKKQYYLSALLLVSLILLGSIVGVILAYTRPTLSSLITSTLALSIVIIFASFILGKKSTIPITIITIALFYLVSFSGICPPEDIKNISHFLTVSSMLTALALTQFLLHSRMEYKSKSLQETNAKLETTNQLLDNRQDELIAANNIIRELQEIQKHEMIQPLTGANATLALVLENEIEETLRERLEVIRDNLTMITAVMTGDYTPVHRRKSQETTYVPKKSPLQVSGDSMTNISKLIRHPLNSSLLSGKDLRYNYEEWEEIITDFSPAEYVPFKLSEMLGIFTNLVKNAARFTNRGGEITVISGVIKSDFHIFVSDTGIGMDDDNQEDVFKVYEKNTTSTGNGLGLAVVKEIVEHHHGDIRISSKIGTGTSFLVTIPIHNQIILYFDDKDYLREILEQTIEKVAGYEIHTFSDATNWQNIIEEIQPDIILLDIDMPGISGDAVIERARPLYPDKIFIAFTANIKDYQIESYQNLGFDYILGKPASPENIRECLMQLR